jgi:hypothetical protein
MSIGLTRDPLCLRAGVPFLVPDIDRTDLSLGLARDENRPFGEVGFDGLKLKLDCCDSVRAADGAGLNCENRPPAGG